MSDVRESLRQLSERGSPRSADVVYEAAVARAAARVRRSRRPGWRTALVVTAAVAVVAGGLVLLLRPGGHRATTIETTRPSAVVPWAPLPMGPGVFDIAVPTPPPPRGASPCTAKHLRVTSTYGNGYGGHTLLGVTLTNVGASPCLADGYPTRLQGVLAGGRTVELHPEHGTYAPAQLPADIAPGSSATLLIEAEHISCAPPPTSPSYVSLLVGLPGGGSVTVRPPDDASGAPPRWSPECSVSVGTIGIPSPDPTYVPRPMASLRPTLALPASVRAGETLRYTVTLTNQTDAPIPLDPCPDYQQLVPLAPIKDPHQLNCGAAAPVAAHGRETFAMELSIPASTSTGPHRLQWLLLVGMNPPTAEAQFIVTAPR